jgi:hypothetical protein
MAQGGRMQTRLNEEIDLGAPAEIVPIGFRKIQPESKESCLTVFQNNRYNLTAKILGG